MASIGDLRKRFHAGETAKPAESQPANVVNVESLSQQEMQALREQFGPMDAVQLVIMKQLIDDEKRADETVTKGCPICGNTDSPILESAGRWRCGDCGVRITAPMFPEIDIIERLDRHLCPRCSLVLEIDLRAEHDRVWCPKVDCGFWCSVSEFFQRFVDRRVVVAFPNKERRMAILRDIAAEFNACVEWVKKRGKL